MFSAKSLAHLSFWLSAIVIGMTSWALYVATNKQVEASWWVSHTHEVLYSIAEVSERLSRAESAQRGFHLVGSDLFVLERDAAIGGMHSALARVKLLTSDNPTQQSLVMRLEELVPARIDTMHANARLRRSEGIDAVRTRVVAGDGRRLSAAIHDLSAEMKQEELRLLELRRADAEQRRIADLRILLAAVLVGVTVLVPGYLGFIYQTRARERAERQLLEMAESLPGAVYRRRRFPDGSSRFEFVSESAAQLLGIEREALLRDPKLFWNAVLEEDRPAYLAALEKAARTLELQSHDFRVKQPNGGIRWVRSTAALRRDADGSVLWNGYWADITEKKQLEDSLLQRTQELGQSQEVLKQRSADLLSANRFLDSVIENIPAVIFIKDAEQLRFVRINRANEELVGYSQNELFGKNGHDFFPKEEADFFAAKDREVLARGVMIDTAEEPVHTRNNGVRILQTKKIPIFDDAGRPRYLLGISRDITQEKEKAEEVQRLNEELRRHAAAVEKATRAKSAFLATMSHEIRTPMNGMLGMIELLSLTRLDAEQRATLAIVRASGNSLLRIIDDILDLSRIEAGRLEVRPEVTSIAEVIEGVHDIYSGNASSKGLLLKRSVDPAISPALRVDPLRLRHKPNVRLRKPSA